jgi:amidophosphoribosyltransferase
MGLHESCGIFGIYARGEDVARLTYFALYALQHRGQESAGIAASDGRRIYVHAAMGLVAQAFSEGVLNQLEGHIAIGHNRYSTTGSSRIANAQPIVVESSLGEMALGHNGNIINAQYLRSELEGKGYVFSTATDSEVVAYLIASAPGKGLEDKIRYAMGRLQGAYSLVLLTKDKLIGIRDPLGVRPLCLGSVNGNWVLSSESCALDQLGMQFLREVAPGEAVIIDDSGIYSFMGADSVRRALCIFEYIYFARPDSLINGRRLYSARQAMGAGLFREHPVDADLVIGVPDSATAAGVGYSQVSGIPFSEGLLKSRYVGRTFIEPDQRLRDIGVRLKFNPLPEVLSGKRVVVVDDSIVRCTTTPRIVSLLRRAGAKEVHMRICAPPIRYPCFFGIDMATRQELIAAQRSIPEICEFIGADSLGYLSLDGLIEAVGLPRDIFCLACFTGEYPVPIQLEMDKLALETK